MVMNPFGKSPAAAPLQATPETLKAQGSGCVGLVAGKSLLLTGIKEQM
jgi:hypothetical protein